MNQTERSICWISAGHAAIFEWSPSGHTTGQIVPETAYVVTNL
ncbi:MAG: hypothetical protein ACFFCX_07850 [Candidatus Sifarchaeia archaeon]